jgi:hypothetical protein
VPFRQVSQRKAKRATRVASERRADLATERLTAPPGIKNIGKRNISTRIAR